MVSISSSNSKHYESLGYVIPRRSTRDGLCFKRGTRISVRVDHLPLGSHVLVTKVCDNCGNEARRVPYKDVLKMRNSEGDRCRPCGTSITHTAKTREKAAAGSSLLDIRPDIASEWCPTNELGPHEVLPGSHVKVMWKGRDCGHHWIASVDDRSAGTGCPVCKESRGEREVRKFLDLIGVEYSRQVSFPGLNGMAGSPLRFDFALVSDGYYLGLIEYDGQQHFHVVDFEGNDMDQARQKFFKLKEHDKRKNDWCEINDIPLLRISYREFDRIGSLVSSFVQLIHLEEAV